MKSILTFIYITSIAFTSLGQIGVYELDSLGTRFAEDLIDNELTESAIVYISGCYGCHSLDNCQCDGGLADLHIIWADKKPKIKKITCCSIFYAKNFADLNVLNLLKEDSNTIFSSDFKFEYLQTHSDFEIIKLVTKDSIETIKLKSEFFDLENKYRKANLEQPAKVFLEELKKAIRTANQSEWTVEH
ncbi:MAG: hypothetical protein RIC03_00420 [Cyclobacteriaceae bacterium]